MTTSIFVPLCVATLVSTLFLHNAFAAGKGGAHAHEHGVVKMDVVVDKGLVSIQVMTPLDSVLGFERAPRNDKERRAAADMLGKLHSGAGLFVLDAAAQCQAAKIEVLAPLLETGKATVTTTTPAAAAAMPAAKEEHADLHASFEFNCQQPQQLRSLELGLFDVFKRAQRIDVQVAGPKGQSRATLKRPARIVNLSR